MASDALPDNLVKPTLEVNSKGEALVTYGAAGAQRHILIWGAIDATASQAGGPEPHGRGHAPRRDHFSVLEECGGHVGGAHGDLRWLVLA